MDIKEILGKCDHTLLGQTATWDEIKAICDDGIKKRYGENPTKNEESFTFFFR